MSESFIRPVNMEDEKMIWEIRDHPLIRNISTQTKKISYNQHKVWFEDQYFGNKPNQCFVVEEENKVVGYCRFDFDAVQDCYIVSIALDPGFHGRGLGHKLLSRSLNRLQSKKNVLAKVRSDNLVSLKLFFKNHFITYQQDDQFHYLKRYAD